MLAATVLTHQPTGLWASLIVLGITIGRGATLTVRLVTSCVLAAAVGGAVVALWPYYSATDLLTSASDFDLINRGTFDRVHLSTFLAWPGAVFLLQRLRRDRRDPIGIAALLLLVVFTFGWFAQRGSLGRVMPGLMLMSHIAMADWFAGRCAFPSRAVQSTRAIRLGLVAILLSGILGTATNWLRSVPRGLVPTAVADQLRLRSYVAPNFAFDNYFTEDDVVAAVPRASLSIGATSASVVAVPIPEPLIDDHEERLRDVSEMLDASTAPGRRSMLIEEYGVTFLVVEHIDAARLLAQLAGSAVDGTVNGLAIICLDPSTDNERAASSCDD